jgi:hypothetical protein
MNNDGEGDFGVCWLTSKTGIEPNFCFPIRVSDRFRISSDTCCVLLCFSEPPDLRPADISQFLRYVFRSFMDVDHQQCVSV